MCCEVDTHVVLRVILWWESPFHVTYASLGFNKHRVVSSTFGKKILGDIYVISEKQASGWLFGHPFQVLNRVASQIHHDLCYFFFLFQWLLKEANVI